LHRRDCLRFTWRGRLLLLVAAVVSVIVLGRAVHPFLALEQPVASRLLVVEGWLPDYGLAEAAAEFQTNGYAKLYVTGVPLTEGGFLSEYKTLAQVGAATLLKMGLSSNVVEAVPAPEVRQDRTYASAVALRERLRAAGLQPESLMVISHGPHARRTRLLFEKAMGPSVKIGIKAVPVREYDPKRWWTSSSGVRTVVDEVTAYFYARLLFRAKEP
jgi:hypothetical protein